MRGGRVSVGVGVKTWPGNGVKVGVQVNVGVGVRLPVAVPVAVQVAVNVLVNVGVGFPCANNLGKDHGHCGTSDIVIAASAIAASVPCFTFVATKLLSTLNYDMMTWCITRFTLLVRN